MVYLLIKLVISLIKAMSTDMMPQQMGVISGNSLPGFGFTLRLPRCTVGILPKVGTCPFPTLPVRARPQQTHFEAGSRNPLKSPHSPPDPRSPADKPSLSRERAVSIELWQDKAGVQGCIRGPTHPRSSSPCVHHRVSVSFSWLHF